MMNIALEGKRALVTGASQGIGRATAELLAKAGCEVILVSRTQTDLDVLAAEIGDSAVTCALDLSDASAAGHLADRFPDIDLLVNNAGAIPAGGIDDLDDAQICAAYDLKLFGYIRMCRAFYPRMRERGRGVIVNVIGIGGVLCNPAYIYGATANAGLMAFTQSLGSASHRDGIRVVGINPGPVSTARLATLHEASRDEHGRSSLFNNLPFGRAAQPEEIASMIAFLASDLCGYVSGAIVPVDGGRSASAAGA